MNSAKLRDDEIAIDNTINFSGSVTGYKIDAELEKNNPII